MSRMLAETSEVILYHVGLLKEKMIDTDMTKLNSHDLVKFHTNLTCMLDLVFVAMKAKCFAT